MSNYDVLIKNAIIVDGTGSLPFKGEVAVNGERIAGIGDSRGAADNIIDAGGKIVCPGFIDVHNHGDISIMYYPRADGFLRQGITTFIGGQCGSSPAPIDEYVVDASVLYDLFQELNPAMYYPSDLIKREAINPRHKELRARSDYLEKTVSEVAEEKKIEPLEALFDILADDPYIRIAGMSFASPLRAFFCKHPAMMAGIDTLAVDTTWKTEAAPWYLPSQNSFNGFAAYFEDIVREEKILGIEQAVHHVTGLPAKKFKLRDRGVLRKDAFANIVVMDLDRVKDMSTPLNPCVYPDGIDHVLVNGGHVVKDMAHTGERPGKILYRE